MTIESAVHPLDLRRWVCTAVVVAVLAMAATIALPTFTAPAQAHAAYMSCVDVVRSVPISLKYKDQKRKVARYNYLVLFSHGLIWRNGKVRDPIDCPFAIGGRGTPNGINTFLVFSQKLGDTNAPMTLRIEVRHKRPGAWIGWHKGSIAR